MHTGRPCNRVNSRREEALCHVIWCADVGGGAGLRDWTWQRHGEARCSAIGLDSGGVRCRDVYVNPNGTSENLFHRRGSRPKP